MPLRCGDGFCTDCCAALLHGGQARRRDPARGPETRGSVGGAPDGALGISLVLPPRTAMPVGLHGDHGWGYENGALGARWAETLLPPACLTCSLSLAHVGGFASLGTLC